MIKCPSCGSEEVEIYCTFDATDEHYVHCLKCGTKNSYYEDEIPNEWVETNNEEHFDNPPLKFEELHENMWCWDNEYKHFIKIRRVKNKSFVGYYPNFEIDPFTDEKYEDLQSIFFFEENRFYRKQVEE